MLLLLRQCCQQVTVREWQPGNSTLSWCWHQACLPRRSNLLVGSDEVLAAHTGEDILSFLPLHRLGQGPGIWEADEVTRRHTGEDCLLNFVVFLYCKNNVQYAFTRIEGMLSRWTHYKEDADLNC